MRRKAPRESLGFPVEHGTLWNLDNAVAYVAMETAAKQTATMKSTLILASPVSGSGASVAEAEGMEYQPTPLRSGLFVASKATNKALRRASSTTRATMKKTYTNSLLRR